MSDSTSPALSPFAARVEAYAAAEAARQNGYTADWNAAAAAAMNALPSPCREMAKVARAYAAAVAIRSADDRAMGYVSYAGVAA